MGERGDNPLDIDVLVIAASSERRALLSGMAAKTTRCNVTTGSTLSEERIQQTGPDIVLIDADTPATASATLRVAETLPDGIGFVVLVDTPDSGWVSRAVKAGINAVLSREVSSDELHLAILAAESGFVLLHPTSAADLIQQSIRQQNILQQGILQQNLLQQNIARRDLAAHDRTQAQEPPASIEGLTRREQQILRLMSDGLGNKEIARKLNISGHTVKFHISSILGKMGAASRTEAVSQGIRLGLIAI